MRETVAIRVDLPDPVAGTGVLTQLRFRPEVVIAGPPGRPAVALAVLADAGDDALSWLRSLRAGTGLPIVVVIGPADPAPRRRILTPIRGAAHSARTIRYAA